MVVALIAFTSAGKFSDYMKFNFKFLLHKNPLQSILYYIVVFLGYTVQSYVGIHLNTELTCTNENSNRMLSQQFDNESACQETCDADDSCKFFFWTIERWCVTYRSCEGKRIPNKPGTTYKKTHQKGKYKTYSFHYVFYEYYNKNCLSENCA